MKIGDLVKWHASEEQRDLNLDTGIIVGERFRAGCNGESPAISYAVAWFDAKPTFWHNDYNLEILNENR